MKEVKATKMVGFTSTSPEKDIEYPITAYHRCNKYRNDIYLQDNCWCVEVDSTWGIPIEYCPFCGIKLEKGYRDTNHT